MPRLLDSRVGFALVAGLYLLSFPYHPGLRSPNELSRLWQARALVDFGTYAINGPLQQLGMVGDLSCTAAVEEGGRRVLKPCVGPDAPPREAVLEVRYYPAKAPLASALAAPVYWLLSRLEAPVSELLQVAASRLVVTVLPALWLLWLLRRFLKAYLPEEVADVGVVTYAMGTLAYSYAETFMSHQLTAVLLFAAFFAAWRVERGEWGERGYLLAGLLAGAVVAAEYTGALGVLCVAAYVVASRWGRWAAVARAAGLVLVGAAAPLAFLFHYHSSCYGGPLVSGYAYLNDAGYMHWHQGGFLGIKLPDARALGLSFFSPLRGLFALSPFLLAVPFGLQALKARDRALFVFTVVLLAANTYFTASFSYDSWGWTVGPRHLTPMLPFLVLPVGLAVEGWQRAGGAAWRSVALGLCASSVLATGLVCFVNYVPDDVSTSLWGLAIPLLRAGLWPVSWLAAWIPNPTSGALLLAMLVGLVAWLLARAARRLGAVPALLALALVAHFGVLLAATRNDSHDEGARSFLTKVWVAPVGQRLGF